MAFAIRGTETVMIKTGFFAMGWQGLTFALTFLFSISTNIENKKVILEK